MNSIIDEGVPRDLVKLLGGVGCDVAAFPNEWKGTKNGRLLMLIKSAGFDCLVTCDKNLRHQQNLAASSIAVVVLPTQALDVLRRHVEMIAEAIRNVRASEVVVIPSAVEMKRGEE